MIIQRWRSPVRFLIRRSIRYLLVSHGFRLVQFIVVLAVLSFALTGSRIVAIDRYGSRADIVATIFITIVTIGLLSALNMRVKTTIDRRFFREAYNAELVLTELGEAIPTLSKTKQLVDLVAEKVIDALHPENVTIFLEDETSGRHIAVFSSNTSKADNLTAPKPHTLWLPYNEGLIERLSKAKSLKVIDFNEVDVLSWRTGFDSTVLSDHERQTLEAVGSSLLIPITSRSRLHGVISLGRRLSDLPYANEDKRLLIVVAHQMGGFIENRRLIGRMVEEERVAGELTLAAEVQRHLFPAEGLEDNDVDIYGTCLPALGVGGDYYDYFEMGECRIGIAIADVAGKGIAAALLMSSVQASLHSQLTLAEKPLPDVVSSMNRLLKRSTSDRGYATFFLADFNKATRALTYVNAGHNPPMLLGGRVRLNGRAGESQELRETNRYLSNNHHGTTGGLALSVAEEPVIKVLTTGGPIIGAFPHQQYDHETIQLHRGDTLAVYTDGVTEAVNSDGVEFGEEKLRSILVETFSLSARQSAEKVIDAVQEWQGHARQHDDITLIVMKVK